MKDKIDSVLGVLFVLLIIAVGVFVGYRPPLKGVEEYKGNEKVYGVEQDGAQMYFVIHDDGTANLYIVMKAYFMDVPYFYGGMTEYAYSSVKYTSLLRYFNYLPRTDLDIFSIPGSELSFLKNIAFYDSKKEQRAYVTFYPVNSYMLNARLNGDYEGELSIEIDGLLIEKEDALKIEDTVFYLLSGEKLKEAEKTIKDFENMGILIK